MNFSSIRRFTTAAAFLLTLGFGTSSCEDALQVEPRASLDAEAGLETRQDIEAGLLGAYDVLQSVNYWGLRYQLFADLGADNARHTGTFPSFAQIAQNQILPDNVEVTSMWNSIYGGINRANFIIQQAEKLNDPAFNKNQAIAEARALRAFHYMNLIGYWGGSPQGYGYAGGLGVPLRVVPTTNITGSEIAPIARASEAEVNALIRSDLDFAIANLGGSNKARITKAGALALRSRFELRNRNYDAVINYTAQITGFSLEPVYANIFTQKNSAESIWELPFDNVDSNSLAFFWFPSANGGRNEVDPATALPAAHESGDTRLPVNAVTAANATPVYPTGTTRKYFRVAAGDDNAILVRHAEVLLTRAEALAQNGDLVPALGILNTVRSRAGLTPRATTLTKDQLIAAILQERRIELAQEGHRWFDLRRTNTVQAARADVTQTFRHLWPIPQRELQTSPGVVEQNPGY
ncbi:RagB/SusD family nutrient uptake outer membrane protein [Hymenobacter oligotrophus]|uniref:RagB/SusD family nutrient uptake outer membrane protein n=1 Tax=Hymenobacter oligotrophus TaxID=2319843 RepID=A0A3B7QWB0_9BACT|nr:RagB/SusD family nutrient uptake outer membrane protein [Hymenobacter oligotrophus]AYA35592.1 RagB/SusD family nutrient uptake outer membrane protein [Hymenobacter oligotrophus]